MKFRCVEITYSCHNFIYTAVVVFLALTEIQATNEGRIRPGLITWPAENTEATEGDTVEFRWRFALSGNDLQRLEQIEFGYCYKTTLNKTLIAVQKLNHNNSTNYTYNVTQVSNQRLRWVGGMGIASFQLHNIIKQDSNSYIMVMSFGGVREPITDHVELIVKYPPKIISKTASIQHVRFPEGVLVHISCTVTSCPRAQVTWYHDGHVIQNRTDKQDFTINEGRVGDSGVYRCVARNELGTDVKQVLVIVTSCKGKSNHMEITEYDDLLHETNDSDSLLTMIVPGVVFLVIFSAYFYFRCPSYRNRKKRNRALLNSKATSMSTNDEQTTSLLADWSNYNDSGEKV